MSLSTEKSIALYEGNIAGLIAAVTALAMTVPASRRTSFAKHFEAVFEALEAGMLMDSHPQSEHVLAGMRMVRSAVESIP